MISSGRFRSSAAKYFTQKEALHVKSSPALTDIAQNDLFVVLSLHMKKDLHPENYRKVIFEDVTSGKRFLIGSTIDTQKSDKFDDGKEYPVFQVEISSASHPFYTGTAKTIDTAGRVERFKTRAAKKKSGK